MKLHFQRSRKVVSVTRFVHFLPLLEIFKVFSEKNWDCILNLAILSNYFSQFTCYWPNFHCCKWPKENKPSGDTADQPGDVAIWSSRSTTMLAILCLNHCRLLRILEWHILVQIIDVYLDTNWRLLWLKASVAILVSEILDLVSPKYFGMT